MKSMKSRIIKIKSNASRLRCVGVNFWEDENDDHDKNNNLITRNYLKG